jgi:hypothetical protein
MIIVDNFIQDLDFLDKISEDKNFWEPGYRWYDGWWKSEPKDLREELVIRLWGENSPHHNVQVNGFEHWIGDYGSENNHSMLDMEWSLKPHFDKDETLWSDEKQMVGPKIGTVFYPCKEIDEMEGGMLYIWDKYDHHKLTPEGWLTFPEQEPQIIAPKFNRLIIFDASKLHAVSHVKKGRRRAIAVNLWDKKPKEFNKDY